ncbi:MAG: UDP-N-acetylmuramoyl-L-alanine--D-glutamate ligase [Gammaproteobacteria bacterium]
MNTATEKISSSADQKEPHEVVGRTVILGLGATGLSVARHVAATGQSILVFDSRRKPPALEALRTTVPDAEVSTGTLDVRLPDDASRLIVSPGLSLELPVVAEARARGIPVIGDIELFARIVSEPVAAITGSNGKSTVATMLASMAQSSGRRVLAGGNLGLPALDLLTQNPVDLYVLELSSFQLESTASLRPESAVVLNVSADHIDRHGSLSSYAEIKATIYNEARHIVANRDDAIVMSMLRDRDDVITFGLDEPDDGYFGLISDKKDGIWLARGSERLMLASELRVAGRHNMANALAAIAMGTTLDLDTGKMLDALRAYRGLAHRTTLLGESGGVTWVNDSKATNVGATVAAISGLDGKIVLIAGGDGKEADFSPLARAARDRVRAAVLLGADAHKLAALFYEICPTVIVDNMKQAVREAGKLAESGDTVLLSPACSSLDMYSDYAARGEAFERAFRELQS